MALASDDLADRSGLVDIEALEDLLRTASWCDLSFWVDGDSAVVEFVPRSVPADVLPVSFDWGLAGSCKHLLIETDDAIEQVAAKVGYGDASNFRRAFRRWTGFAPLQYRARQRAARSDAGP